MADLYGALLKEVDRDCFDRVFLAIRLLKEHKSVEFVAGETSLPLTFVEQLQIDLFFD